MAKKPRPSNADGRWSPPSAPVPLCVPPRRRFGVSLSTLQQWVRRARGQRLDRVDWSDQAPGPRRSSQRTDAVLEEWIGELRRQLRQTSDLGEYGAAALRREWLDPGFPDPPVTHTIHRILRRRGRLDGPRRQRRPAPPPGWYLTEVAARRVERDRFDRIEGLALEGGAEVQTLTAVSLHGGLAAVTAQTSVETLLGHGRQVGLPGYAPFDNDTRFQGPRMDPDSLGRVIRLCLQWGVTPVFAPPLERGFQAAIESFNGRWQGKGGARFHPASRQALAEQSAQLRRGLSASDGDANRRGPGAVDDGGDVAFGRAGAWRGQGISCVGRTRRDRRRCWATPSRSMANGLTGWSGPRWTGTPIASAFMPCVGVRPACSPCCG